MTKEDVDDNSDRVKKVEAPSVSDSVSESAVVDNGEKARRLRAQLAAYGDQNESATHIGRSPTEIAQLKASGLASKFELIEEKPSGKEVAIHTKSISAEIDTKNQFPIKVQELSKAENNLHTDDRHIAQAQSVQAKQNQPDGLGFDGRWHFQNPQLKPGQDIAGAWKEWLWNDMPNLPRDSVNGMWALTEPHMNQRMRFLLFTALPFFFLGGFCFMVGIMHGQSNFDPRSVDFGDVLNFVVSGFTGGLMGFIVERITRKSKLPENMAEINDKI